MTAAEDDIQIVTKARLEQARKAIDSGDFALAKGLADSVLRDVRETSDAMQEVQRALRQSKQITAGFPSGAAAEEWEVRLKQVDASAEAGEWTSAAEELRSLTADLQALQVQMSEAEETARIRRAGVDESASQARFVIHWTRRPDSNGDRRSSEVRP